MEYLDFIATQYRITLDLEGIRGLCKLFPIQDIR